MEKNIRKRVCWLAAVLSAVLVVLFGYWFFLNPHGYWQKKEEALKNEYMDRRMLWRKSEKMTEQQMLSDMTLMAFGDGGNDVLMLKHVGIGVAMGNAEDEVKRAADYVTDSVDEDGVEKALRHFGVI